jgi:hypothetical protein
MVRLYLLLGALINVFRTADARPTLHFLYLDLYSVAPIIFGYNKVIGLGCGFSVRTLTTGHFCHFEMGDHELWWRSRETMPRKVNR